jgi:anti-sigma regulatory factor (Ser/Thr protein kinase)
VPATCTPTETGITLSMAADVFAPRKARKAACDYLTGMSDTCIEACELIADELVTNAVEHTYGRRPVELVVAIRDDGVYIAVRDYAAGAPHRAMEPHTGTSGRGLMIVDALASRWGWNQVAGGKVVWAIAGVPA